MNYFQTAAIAAAQTGKFAGVMNGRISKPPVQTIFQAIDVFTPRLKAAVSPADQIMRALKPVNPLAMAGRL